MDRIQHLADFTVRKGLFFAMIAIGTVMLGFSYDIALCLRSGALLVTITAAVLALKTMYARNRNHRATELWALLHKGDDLPPGYPPENINEVLRQTYAKHAVHCAFAALALCLMAVLAAILKG